MIYGIVQVKNGKLIHIHVMKTINKFNTSAVSLHIESWSLIDWENIYEYVKKLRQRIFRAEQLGHKKTVRWVIIIMEKKEEFYLLIMMI
jgi:RNA-directed DNA polymerase